MSTRLDHIVERAIAEGVLPADAVASPPPDRPWPIILMTAIGVWLAVIPILILIVLFLDEFWRGGEGPIIVGFLALGVAVAMLRKEQLALFLEQLAIALMLAGSAAIAYGLEKYTSDEVASALLGMLALAVAYLARHNWLRTLLGGTACGLMLMTVTSGRYNPGSTSMFFALHLAMTAWATSQLAKQMVTTNHGVPAARAIDAISMGWGAVTLAGLALCAGRTFLTGAIFGDGDDFGSSRQFSISFLIWHVISALTAAAAASHLLTAWPSLRQAWATVVAGVAFVLSLLMPSLGATLLFLAMCATAGRWRMAACAGLASAWVIGAFYYQVSMPFATKAVIMIAAGIALGASAWLSLRDPALLARLRSTGAASLRGSAGIAATAFATLLVVNGAIWQKEDLIANGKPVFVELGPVDPRSLMQGDFMRLTFAIPQEVAHQASVSDSGAMVAVGKIDARGVLTLQRADDGGPLAADERRLRVTINGSGARIVTDAWYFREGEAERYAGARYGEFRLLDNGRALLVDMRGPNLEKL